jgi:hypothetical protein
MRQPGPGMQCQQQGTGSCISLPKQTRKLCCMMRAIQPHQGGLPCGMPLQEIATPGQRLDGHFFSMPWRTSVSKSQGVERLAWGLFVRMHVPRGSRDRGASQGGGMERSTCQATCIRLIIMRQWREKGSRGDQFILRFHDKVEVTSGSRGRGPLIRSTVFDSEKCGT